MKKFAIVALSAVALAACGGDTGGVDASDVWARTSAPGQTTGAVYLDLTVDADDTLVGAAVPASVATRAEIHEVVEADIGEMDGTEMSDDMDDMDMSEGSHDMDEMDMGAMQMQEMPNGLALAADETVSFEPGSYHVMLAELAEPLVAGDEFELTLSFENADDMTVTVEVADDAP